MYTELGVARLKTGEPIRLGAVVAPDAEWAPRLRALLGHKPPVYLYHIERSLLEPLDDLETLYYVGDVDGVPVTVAMVAGGHGAGIFGHVYTVPAWRQRGASGLLHETLAADVRSRGYRALSLGTNPDGHARRIYEAIGFHQVVPGSGDMIWRADGQAGPGPGVITVGPARWGDWGWVSEACCEPVEAGEELPRSTLLRVRAAGHVESAYVDAMRGGADLHVLRVGAAAVGWAALLRGPAAAVGAAALEWYARPGYRAEAARLLSGLEWPDQPVVCALAGGPGYRAEGLAAHGFREVGRWPRWWDVGRGREDAVVWARA